MQIYASKYNALSRKHHLCDITAKNVNPELFQLFKLTNKNYIYILYNNVLKCVYSGEV